MRHRVLRGRYEDVVLRTKPVLYLPLQGSRLAELVREGTVTVTATTADPGPFPGAVSRGFTSSTADNDRIVVTSDASYHPGDTFSVGGWINRNAAGDTGNGPVVFHFGASNDAVIWYGTSGDKLTLRKAGVGNIFATDRTFPSPYADGFHHCIFTKNAGTATLCYIDGLSVTGTYSNQTIVASSSDLKLGISSDSATGDFAGRVAHWAVWNRVLTAAEVAELYRAGRERM